MKNTILTLIILFTQFFSIYAQDTKDTSYWKKGGVGSLMFTQLSLTNWAAGGQNSVSLNTFVNLFANYKKNKTTWDNSFDVAYGIIKNTGTKIRKSDDRIEFNSKYGQYAFKHWYYAGLVNFKTQMAPGYNYPNDSVRISSLMAPAYASIAVGMDFKPSPKFTLFLSPVTGKMTFVLDDSLSALGAFGVEAGKTFRGEFGGYLKSVFKTDIGKNISFQTKLDLFSNYLHNPQNVDVNWEVLVAMKFSKYITATLNTLLIYDDDIMITDKEGKTGPRTQFKEIFGLGLSYKF